MELYNEPRHMKAVKFVMFTFCMINILDCLAMNIFSIAAALNLKGNNTLKVLRDFQFLYNNESTARTIAIISLAVTFCIALFSFYLKNGTKIFIGAFVIAIIQFIMRMITLPLCSASKMAELSLNGTDIGSFFPAFIILFIVSFENINILIGSLGIVLEKQNCNVNTP